MFCLLVGRRVRSELDLALAFREMDCAPAPSATEFPIGELPISWIGPLDWTPPANGPLPLVLFEQPCIFRRAGLEALDRAGTPWRVTFTSPSLAGVWAAVAAGLGVTIRTAASPPRNLRVLGETDGLPALPNVSLAIYGGIEASPVVTELRSILIDAVRDGLRDR